MGWLCSFFIRISLFRECGTLRHPHHRSERRLPFHHRGHRDVQAQSLGGALVLELQATYVGTVETFPLTIPALNGASAVNTLTIRPASGATALAISSANTTAATVDLNGAQFVTIDGRPGGVGSNAGSGGGAASQLTIANTSTSGVALRFINEASGNTLRYTTLRGASLSTIVFSTTTGANGNDNNLIDHCDIRDGAGTPANGIYSFGFNGTATQYNSSNTVSNCNFFNFHRLLHRQRNDHRRCRLASWHSSDGRSEYDCQ